jgi:hypothetical protein
MDTPEATNTGSSDFRVARRAGAKVHIGASTAGRLCDIGRLPSRMLHAPLSAARVRALSDAYRAKSNNQVAPLRQLCTSGPRPVRPQRRPTPPAGPRAPPPPERPAPGFQAHPRSAPTHGKTRKSPKCFVPPRRRNDGPLSPPPADRPCGGISRAARAGGSRRPAAIAPARSRGRPGWGRGRPCPRPSWSRAGRWAGHARA